MKPGYAASEVLARRRQAKENDDASWSGWSDLSAGERAVLTPSGGWRLAQRNDAVATRLDETDLEWITPFLVRELLLLSPGRRLAAGEWTVSRPQELTFRGIRYVGTDVWQGATYEVVEWAQEQDYALPQDDLVFTIKLWIGQDHIIRKVRLTDPQGNWTEHRIVALTIDPAITKNDFPLQPPGGVAVRTARRSSSPILHVGDRFPDFTAQLPGSDTITSSRLLAQKKAILLWQWSYG
jgi:hypothetical protein